MRYDKSIDKEVTRNEDDQFEIAGLVAQRPETASSRGRHRRNEITGTCSDRLFTKEET